MKKLFFLIQNLKFKIYHCFLLFFFCLPSFALTFNFPQAGDTLIGAAKTAIVRESEDFSDVAERFDVGYYEMFEANPGVDPDDPQEGTVLIVPTIYLLPAGLVRGEILINLAELRLYYVPVNENKVYVFPIGIGKEDWSTPLGELKIIEKIKDPKWVVPESIMKYREAMGDKVDPVVMPGPDNPLGSYALRTSNTTILIHGTNSPDGVGRRSSAGCIRLYPNDIEHLFHLVEIGTRIKIINEPYKVGWFKDKLYLEAHLPLLEQRLRLGNDVSPALHLLEEAGKLRHADIDWDKATKIARDHLAIPQIVEK